MGVYPRIGRQATSTDEMLEVAVEESLNTGIVSHGDLIVITAGVPVGEKGTTNLMKIHVVGDVLASGQGIGRKSAFGKVVVAKTAEEAKAKMTEGAIFVTNGTDKDMMPALEKAAALITEEGGLTSHAAVVGLLRHSCYRWSRGCDIYPPRWPRNHCRLIPRYYLFRSRKRTIIFVQTPSFLAYVRWRGFFTYRLILELWNVIWYN